jgi:hypothetical protein
VAAAARLGRWTYMNSVKRIVKLVLWHDMMVDAMMVLYEHDDGLVLNKSWGCPVAAKCSEV